MGKNRVINTIATEIYTPHKPPILYPIRGGNWEHPEKSFFCFNCWEIASWYCRVCGLKMCKYKDCYKAAHDYEHTMILLAGKDNG